MCERTICKTTLIRLYSIILQTALDIAKNPEYEDYIDHITLIGYFNSIRELGGAVRLLDDDIASRIRVVKNKYNSSEQRYLSFGGKKENYISHTFMGDCAGS